MANKRYSDNLNEAAEQFILDAFERSSEFSEDKDILITAAFCIIEDKSFFNDIELLNKKNIGGN